MTQPKFKINNKLVILIGVKRKPKIVTVTFVFHHALCGWCYIIDLGKNQLTIPQDNLLKTFKAYKIPPDETL